MIEPVRDDMSTFTPFLFLLLLTSCAPVPPRVPCDRCEEPDRFVHLLACEQAFNDDYPHPFRHPVRLTSDDWGILLNSVKTQRRSDRVILAGTAGFVSSAFLPEEVVYLSQTLSSAFAQAAPQDCVGFGLKTMISPTVWEVTTGVWFAGENDLYVVFHNYRAKTTVPSVWENLRNSPETSAGGIFYDFIPNDHQSVRQKGGRIRHLIKRDMLEMAIHHKSMLSTSAQSENQHTPESIPQSLRERLGILRQLYDEGLIPDEEYRMKVKELLGHF